MAILVTVQQIRKAFGARPLFENISLAIESGERIGLIGPNGMGKSTLLKILAQETQPDEGTVSFSRGLRVGYLPQVPRFKAGATVVETVLEGVRDPDDWECQLAAEETIAKLSLVDGPVEKLSGGWKKRVALARELARQPDLLLLDEPTNHLDVESILELERILAGSRFATLTVTHDRVFLQRVSNRIIELDRRNAGGLLSVRGDYARYLETKDSMLQAQEQRETRLKNTLRRETEWLRRGAAARTTKQQARIQRHGALSEEVGELEYRNRSRTARIDFQGMDRSPKKLVEAKALSKSLGGKLLFKGVDLRMGPGTRVGLMGPNGCGKSTLIRTLLGTESPDSGEVFRSDQIQVAYFEQNRETLDPKLSLIRTLCPSGDHVDYRGGRIHIRGYLDRFLFSNDQMEMAVGKLSGGEQSRILLARLMLQPANLLVLDEPTNDLDLETLNVLQDCLTEFPGAVLLVTHDRYFLDQVATQILAFPFDGSGKLTPCADLAQWEAWHEAEESKYPRGAKASSAPPPSPSTAPAASAARRKLSYKDQRELDGMEAAIHAAELELERLTAESAMPEHASNAKKLGELTAALSKAQAEVDRLYARWSELTS
jgi:ABC transport system ATP-binding/permease protein